MKIKTSSNEIYEVRPQIPDQGFWIAISKLDNGIWTKISPAIYLPKKDSTIQPTEFRPVPSTAGASITVALPITVSGSLSVKNVYTGEIE